MDTIRSLLVHADGGSHAAARMTLARMLAAQHEARLRVQFSVLPVPNDLAAEHCHRAKALFERMVGAGGWPMEWAPPTDEQPIPAFSRLALEADLLVLGQRDKRDVDESNVPIDFVESVLEASGTPAIVVPFRNNAAFERFDTVMIASQPSRESARAIAAALPILQRATEVHLTCWIDDAGEAARWQQSVINHLRLHGVDGVQRHRADVPSDVGTAMLTMAGGVGADLLVMGCYSHSRGRELVLGGATRTVLREMHLPVLMAH